MPLVLTLLACGQLNRYDEPDDGVRVQPAAELDDEGEDEPGPKAGANTTNDGDGDGIERRDDCDDDDDTVFPGAVEDCGDGVDSDCDGNDCADWEDGFEGNGGEFDRPWYDGGVADWTLKRNLAHDGTWCAVSGDIDDQEISDLAIDVDTPDGGEVSFWHSGNTELDYDFLRFYVDAEEVGSWSGNWRFQRDTFVLKPGVHTLTWSYTKDVSRSRGDDRALIDDVKVVGGGP